MSLLVVLNRRRSCRLCLVDSGAAASATNRQSVRNRSRIPHHSSSSSFWEISRPSSRSSSTTTTTFAGFRGIFLVGGFVVFRRDTEKKGRHERKIRIRYSIRIGKNEQFMAVNKQKHKILGKGHHHKHSQMLCLDTNNTDATQFLALIGTLSGLLPGDLKKVPSHIYEFSTSTTISSGYILKHLGLAKLTHSLTETNYEQNYSKLSLFTPKHTPLSSLQMTSSSSSTSALRLQNYLHNRPNNSNC